MKKYNVEMNGKIYGQTNDFESAKSFASNLGANAIVFCGGVVAFPL